MTADGVINQLLYPIDGAPDLSDATVTRQVDNLLDGRHYGTGVAEFATAIDQVLAFGELPPHISRRYSDPSLLDYLRRVARELDARRPWPPPLFTKLDIPFEDAKVIAKINLPLYALKAALKQPFDDVLVLRLRTGEEVGVTGSALLYRGPDDPAAVIDHFRQLTGLRPAHITPL